jgi:hypothetical protein
MHLRAAVRFKLPHQQFLACRAILKSFDKLQTFKLKQTACEGALYTLMQVPLCVAKGHQWPPSMARRCAHHHCHNHLVLVSSELTGGSPLPLHDNSSSSMLLYCESDQLPNRA